MKQFETDSANSQVSDSQFLYSQHWHLVWLKKQNGVAEAFYVIQEYDMNETTKIRAIMTKNVFQGEHNTKGWSKSRKLNTFFSAQTENVKIFLFKI